MLRLTKYGRKSSIAKHMDAMMTLSEKYDMVIKREEVELAEENIKGQTKYQFYEKKLALGDEKKELMTQLEDIVVEMKDDL